MRKLLLLALSFITISACTSVTPGAGEEAVLIMQPWIGGYTGVYHTPVKAGQAWTAWSTRHKIVNMQPQLFKIHFEDLMSSEGVPLDFDAVARLQVTSSVDLVQNFGDNWFETNVQPELMNRVRHEVKKHGMNETAIDTRATEEIDKNVTDAIMAYLTQAKIPARLIDFTVGRANPPDAIKHQRVETATQEQRINTEKQRKLAEDNRRAAELARAVADNAYRNEMQLSPEQFLRLETIKMQREVCAVSKTAAGCTFVFPGIATTVPVGNRQ